MVSAIAVLGVVAPGAASDGLPVPVEYTWENGVLSADGSTRYVTLPFKGDTLLMAVSGDGGEIADHTIRNGTFTVPAIALDGTSSGISHDGETLALIKPRKSFPRRTTEFVIYDTDRLRQNVARFELKGDFSFDALSPDGRTLYLIEYTNPRDPGEYQVRSYDIATGRLAPDAILDSEEEPGEMRGLPQTRVTSADGGWEYTLYDGGEHPFIHALDVVDAKTVCIDLDMIKARDTAGATLAMSSDGGSIELTDRKGELRAVVDTDTYEATEPSEEPEQAAAPAETGEGSGLEAAGIAAGGLVLMAVAALGLRRMRR
jgi:hypothetical protein